MDEGMSMITLYLWDEIGQPAGSVECDPLGPLPLRSTPTAPPAGDVRWIGGAWVPAPVQDLAVMQAELREQVTALRWQRETGGLMMGGVRVLTGVEDQNRIASALIGAPATLDFKAESGWVTLTLAELQGIAAAITAHVQACFTAERTHHEAINALTDVADAQVYDVTTGWPV